MAASIWLRHYPLFQGVKNMWEKELDQKTCEHCGRTYMLDHVRYPSRDIAHDVDCECGQVLIHVESGTWDYIRRGLISGPRESAIK